MPAPERSGRLLVRMPKTLHADLAEEAAREGVSLNQLVLVKLSRPLRTCAGDDPGDREPKTGDS